MIFTPKVAKQIAYRSFDYVLDCISGITDLDYSLGDTAENFHQNFEEDMNEKGIPITERRIEVISQQYEKLRLKAIVAIAKLYTPELRKGIKERREQ